MERAIPHGRIGPVEDALAIGERAHHEDFGLLAGLRVALPLGLAIWAVLIWATIRFVV